MPAKCKHTVVRIVSRDEDAEFVECLACGEIFDSVEYEDLAREELVEAEERMKAERNAIATADPD